MPAQLSIVACAAAVMVAAGLANAARADVLLDYSLQGVVFADGSRATGTFVFDATTDNSTSFDITYTGAGSIPSTEITPTTGYFGTNGSPTQTETFYFYRNVTSLTTVQIALTGVTPVTASTTGPVALAPSLSAGEGTFAEYQTTSNVFEALPITAAGVLSPVSAVPEPSSLLLLGAALVALRPHRRR